MAHGRGSRPLACKQCGKRRADGYVISFRALCADCATANLTRAVTEVGAGAGEYHDRWRDGMLRALAGK